MAKKPKVHEYINAQLQVCGKSQKQVAEEVGFPKAIVLTLIKRAFESVDNASKRTRRFAWS